jgi:hypothetical protein
VTQAFTVPANRDRLDVSIASVGPTGFANRIILIDPNGTYEAYSIPQGFNNFGHVDVHFPIAASGRPSSGTRRALASTGRSSSR